ncbi:ribose transport system permease protein RbsC [Thermoclostridium stercorarium subsp. stercorarium DSM 8532]|jgi:rhamnose transport system permease protein|uniref:Ribose transport system permease protein RbsC n=3 Tax=Thermoclostridium stercorarium TaxID=1510 RepID=L7VPK1_THES1|nr:ABC transporter permease [Thermoclostridium stercorarium]AGC67503.1 ribose transport system permease protein RbsC [Thermoclostridium stercorarium subsp. stercorarium DSM 8532]AGI38558.1 ABC transporter permease subunit [Thermoclostridium stercorarium subsp. stercorarium DSM 8532]ANW97930.1 branched-chain amino acid ABC transporter permease [Thermoclostridium stercorarium subsp. thermolacticum DSM 2910]ANX00480.1 branched-chain amino acid ABC transporter permease [Thermoclostridium stercorari
MTRKVKSGILNGKSITEFRELGLLIFIIILSVSVQLRNPEFLTLENINDMLTNTAILSILSVGMMMIIITRGIDLSIGSSLALAGMISALAVSKYQNLSPFVAILIGVAVGLACGVINGLLISKGGVFPIITTLGMMNAYRGLTYIISGGRWVSAHQMPASFKAIATGKILGINNLVFIAVIVYVVFYYFINYTRTGRKIYAVGSNPESAKVSGINNERILFMVYTIMGALAGLAGVMWVSKFASAQGDTASGYEMNVIAACVLGGVSIDGGSGKVSGVVLGSLLFGMLENALPMINVSPFWQKALQGVIILVAVIVNVLVKRSVDRKNLMGRKI